jgi:predicted pyridoxine 5'-phosphate oxidase superfamily flavin-nucleotide-binding protein
LYIPDRIGNNRLDTLTNLASGHASVGLLFLVPGLVEVLRVNGTAYVTEDEGLLAPLAAERPDGSLAMPKAAIVVVVHEAMLHCGRAISRSQLWSQDAQRRRDDFPSLARVICEQFARKGLEMEPGPGVQDGKLVPELYEEVCQAGLNHLW